MTKKSITLGAALGTTFLVAASSVSAQDISLNNGGTLDFYGYVKGDLIFDLDTDLGVTAGGIGGLNAATVQDESFRAQAIESRFGVTYNQGTALGDLKINIEGDFFGTNSSGAFGNFRLRNAYGELNGLLAGQFWTNFMPIESYPNTLDFGGPAGIPFERVTQLRFTTDVGTAGRFSTSIEGHAGSEDSPAFTAAYAHTGNNYFLKAAVLYSELDDGDTAGINLSGNARLWDGGRVQASYTYGEGIGAYQLFGQSNQNGSDFDLGGNAIETSGFAIAVTQAVTDQVSVAATYGYRDIDTFAVDANDTSELETLHLTLNYSPVEDVSYGIEYITGERTEFDGDSFTADRIQASFQYNF